VDLREIRQSRIGGELGRAIPFHLANATLPYISRRWLYLSREREREIPRNFFVLPPSLLAQSWISSNFNCQEHCRRTERMETQKESEWRFPSQIKWFVECQKAFSYLGKWYHKKPKRSQFADRLVQYCFICANFGWPFRIACPVAALSLSLSLSLGDPVHFQQFLLDSISVYVSWLSHM